MLQIIYYIISYYIITCQQELLAPTGCVLALPSSCVMTHPPPSATPPSCHIWIWLLSSAPLSAVGASRSEGGRGKTGEQETGSVGKPHLQPSRTKRRAEGHSPPHSHTTISPSPLSPTCQSSFFILSLFLPLISDIMSSSLLDNPVQAILYLRELTTIVQNQQSLIQTQRARIEELDRRVDELIGENRHLRDVRVQQQLPYLHHHPHHTLPDPSCLHHYHHPQDPQLKTKSGSVPEHAASPAQVEMSPGVQPQPAQPMDPGDMQLVPADPSTISPIENESENDGSCLSCRSLVPMTPTTLCRSLTLSRQSE